MEAHGCLKVAVPCSEAAGAFCDGFLVWISVKCASEPCALDLFMESQASTEQSSLVSLSSLRLDTLKSRTMDDAALSVPIAYWATVCH